MRVLGAVQSMPVVFLGPVMFILGLALRLTQRLEQMR